MTALLDSRRLVVGSDFSPASVAALRLALAWAAGRQWTLEVLHVVHESFPEESEPGLLEQLRSSVATAAERSESVPWTAELCRGELLEELSARARDGAWLVLGTEGSGADALRRTGRTAGRAAYEAEVPVLLAPPRWRPPEKGRRAPVPRFERVLAGLSGGARDEERLRAALQLARPSRPAVAHSVDLSWARCYPAALRSLAGKPAEQAAEAFLNRFLQLEDELVEVGDEGPDLALHLLKQGPAHADLAGLAESQSTELLVVGTGPVATLLAGLVSGPLLVLP